MGDASTENLNETFPKPIFGKYLFPSTLFGKSHRETFAKPLFSLLCVPPLYVRKSAPKFIAAGSVLSQCYTTAHGPLRTPSIT